jgi:hypothetical protein
MTAQTTVDFSYAEVKLIENIFTKDIERRLKKFAWADKLFNGDGTRKFEIVFAPGTNLEFRMEITTQIRLVIMGLSILPGGQAKVVDIDTINRTIAVLQRGSKFIKSSALSLYRQTVIEGGKKVFSGYELSDKLLAIPEEDAEVVSTEIVISYTVKDITNGNVVTVSNTNSPPGSLLFNARVKLNMMRRDDD